MKTDLLAAIAESIFARISGFLGCGPVELEVDEEVGEVNVVVWLYGLRAPILERLWSVMQQYRVDEMQHDLHILRVHAVLKVSCLQLEQIL